MARKSAPTGRSRVHELDIAAPSSTESSRHLLRALEEERKRISRELHDETGQGLMVLRLYLGMLAEEVRKPAAQLKVQQATELLDRAIGDLRRIIARLSPRVLDEVGLLAAIRKEARELSKNKGIKGHLDIPADWVDVDHELEIAIYRSVQEALHNIAKHSQARNFTVQLGKENGTICLLIHDDGVGFSRKGGPPTRSFGLMGMRERIAALGGTVRIRSRSDRGTRVRVMLPASEQTQLGKQEPRGEVAPFIKRAAASRAS